jgi:two-component system LytT family response regulator
MSTTPDALRVLLVDDEPLARQGLRRRLEAQPDIAILRECGSGRQAVAAIQELRPDLVFLDVQMPSLDGFGVIRAIGAERMPAVIFVTAYDEHALRAFEVHALDYLLKPIDDERFAAALDHARATLRQRSHADLARRLDELTTSLAPPAQAPLERLAVKSGGRIVIVAVEDVDWIEAADNYVRLHAGRQEHLLHTSLGGLAARLDPRSFLRIHRSTVVNVKRIRELHPLFHGEYRVVLADGTTLSSGRRYRSTLEGLLGKLGPA